MGDARGDVPHARRLWRCPPAVRGAREGSERPRVLPTAREVVRTIRFGFGISSDRGVDRPALAERFAAEAEGRRRRGGRPAAGVRERVRRASRVRREGDAGGQTVGANAAVARTVGTARLGLRAVRPAAGRRRCPAGRVPVGSELPKLPAISAAPLLAAEVGRDRRSLQFGPGTRPRRAELLPRRAARGARPVGRGDAGH